MQTIKQIIKEFLETRDENVAPDEVDDNEREGSATALVELLAAHKREPDGYMHKSGAMMSADAIGGAFNTDGWEPVYRDTGLELVVDEDVIEAAILSACKIYAAELGRHLSPDDQFIADYKAKDPEDYKGMHEIVSAVLTVGLSSTKAAKRDTWRCFHCNETFHTRESAALHFGYTEISEPMCLIDAGKYREMEVEVERARAEDSNTDRAMYRMRADHNTALTRAEEDGYAKGLRDGQLKVKETLIGIKRAILEAPDGAIEDTLWMPEDVAMGATVVDWIDIEVMAIGEDVDRDKAIAQLAERLYSAKPPTGVTYEAWADRQIHKLVDRIMGAKIAKLPEVKIENFSDEENTVNTEIVDRLREILGVPLNTKVEDVLHFINARSEGLSDGYGKIAQPYAAAIRMIRDAIEEIFGPMASLESEEAVLLRGPEPHHDAEAIIAALQRVKARVREETDAEIALRVINNVGDDYLRSIGCVVVGGSFQNIHGFPDGGTYYNGLLDVMNEIRAADAIEGEVGSEIETILIEEIKKGEGQ